MDGTKQGLTQEALRYQRLIYSSRPVVSLVEWNAMTPAERISRFQSTDSITTQHPSTKSSVANDEVKQTAPSSLSPISTTASQDHREIKDPHPGVEFRLPKSRSTSMLSSSVSSSRQNSDTFSFVEDWSSRPSSKGSWSNDKLFTLGSSINERAQSPQSFVSLNHTLLSAPGNVDAQESARKLINSHTSNQRWSLCRSSSFVNHPRPQSIQQLHSFKKRPGTADEQIGTTTIKRSLSRKIGSLKRALSTMRD